LVLEINTPIKKLGGTDAVGMLGFLLAVFLPFELAVRVLGQLCGMTMRDGTVWQ